MNGHLLFLACIAAFLLLVVHDLQKKNTCGLCAIGLHDRYRIRTSLGGFKPVARCFCRCGCKS